MPHSQEATQNIHPQVAFALRRLLYQFYIQALIATLPPFIKIEKGAIYQFWFLSFGN